MRWTADRIRFRDLGIKKVRPLWHKVAELSFEMPIINPQTGTLGGGNMNGDKAGIGPVTKDRGRNIILERD